MKRIVICCDGTWNTPDQDTGGVPLPTNVTRIAQSIVDAGDDGRRQTTYYGAGVGTDGNKVERAFSGATGLGLSDNLLDAYRFLNSCYQPEDELFLFGFSRGAFTVRSLAGLINNSGILRSENSGMVKRAFDMYRSRSKKMAPREAEAQLFRKTYAWLDRTPIKFIGVWDTVGSLGNPLLMMKSPLSRRYHFHDTNLSSTVENAFHAMAVDEVRRHFEVARWKKQKHSENQMLEQRWFVGVHSDVGGGTPATGLSDTALAWMMGRARACGLALNGFETRPPRQEGPGNSRKGFYRAIPRHYRPIDDNKPEDVTGETLDESVLQRYRDDPDYRPKNLVDYFRRFPDRAPREETRAEGDTPRLRLAS